MGLIAWYPLNGTGESKGLITNKFSIGASEYGDGGKIGKYYLTSNKIKGTGTISGIENFKQVSIAFWFKENKIETTAWQDFMKFYAYYDDGSKQAGGEFRLEQHTSSDKTQVYADWYCSTTSTSYPSYTGAAVYSNSPQITDLGWHHTVLMLDFVNHKCTSYFDGILNKIMDINTNAKYITGGLYIGDADIDAGICDLRLYDNLLSVQEIKDLNNCLILHYPLNSGYGNENLLVNTYEGYYGNGTVLTDETYNGFKIRYLKYEGTSYQDCINKNSIISPTANTYYTISFWAKGNCGISNFFYPNNCASGISSDGHTTTSVDGCCVISLTPEWKRYWITWKTRSDVSGAKNIVVGRIQNQGTGAECYIAGLKFEEGNKNSVWSPNQADNLYSILGYDSTTVYDTSGFGNNGVFNNTKTYSIDTPLYDSSTNLQRTNSNYINLQNTYITNQSTINLWGKVNTFGGWQRFFEFANALAGATGNHRILLGTSQNTQRLGLHIYGGDTGTTSLYENSNITTIDMNWHMYSIVFNKTNLKVFIDGTSIVDKTMTQELTSMVRQYSYIGKSSYSADAYFDGNISDFRIYSTALSAEDIKQLYQSKARIDKNGNVYCNQFVESSDMGNLLDDYQYPVNSTTHSGVFSKVLVDCQDSITGKATKMTCNTAGLGFYIGGCWNTARSKFVNGKQYIWSMYVKSDNRTSITFSVECSSKQSKNTFVIDTNYRRIESVFTYSNSTAYSAFTCYSNFKVDENLYIHTFSVDEYNPKTNVDKKGILHTNSLIEIKSEEKCKIYKQDIQSNEIIEI